MDYAVVKISGTQFLVSNNELVEVYNLNLPEGEVFEINEVLLTKTGDKVEIGHPFVATKLFGKVVKNFKGEKIDVLKFKAKSRYRRKTGFRQSLTQVQVMFDKNQSETPKKEAKETKAPKKEVSKSK